MARAARSAVEPLEGRVLMTTVTLNPTDDAYARDGTYASAAQSATGANPAELQVKTIGSSSFNRDAYLKFAPSVPAGNVVTGATLRVWGQAVVGSTYTGPTINGITVSAYPLTTKTASWGESTLTWNNKPGLNTGTALGQATVSTAASAWYAINLTSFFAGEVAAARTPVTVGLHAAAAVDVQANLDSDEATHRPELILDYSAPTLVLSGAALSVPEGSSASLNVKLPSAPAANVTVTVGKQAGGDADLTSSTTTLTFTPANWNAYQPVTVAAAHDADTAAGTATFNLSATGYGSASFAATEAEDDVALAPTADAFVRDGTYATTNFGTDTSLEAKSVVPTSFSRTSYLKFDLTSAPAAVGQAKLRVYGSTSGVASPPLSVSARKPTTNQPTWSESTVNWNNKPVLATTALSSVDVGATAGWYELDVTAYVQAERAAGRNALTLGLTAETKDMLASLVSREGAAGNRPQLVVLGGTVTPTPTPTPLPPTVATAAAATPNPVTGTSAALSVLGADDGGEPALTYTWQVDSAPAGAPAVTFGASGTNAAKATTATFGAAGTYVLRATIADAINQTVASTVTVTVAQTLTTLTVQPDPAPTLAPFGTATFGVAAADQFGSPIATPPAVTWTATGGTVDAAGLFTAGAAAGAYTVTATSGSASDGASATVVNAAPTLDAAPTATLGADGKTVDLHVRATDDGGPGNLTYTWAVTPPSGVAAPAIAPNADVTANDASTTLSAVGTYAFTVTVADASGGSTTYPTTVSVTAAPVLTVTPGNLDLTGGTSQAFAVSDQFGHTYSGGAATWSVAGAAGGTVDSAGLYTAAVTGNGDDVITATVGSATATATVHIAGIKPIASYPFEVSPGGVTPDEAPAHAHPGTLSGAVLAPSTRAGDPGNAAVFDGVDDVITVADAADLDNVSKLTISLWMNPSVSDGEARGLISKRDTHDAEEAYAIFYRNGRLEVDLDSTNDRFVSNAIIPTGIWTKVDLTFDGTAPASERAKLYLNGVRDRTATESSTTVPATDSDLYIGMLKRNSPEVNAYFGGAIDDVQIFPAVLPIAPPTNGGGSYEPADPGPHSPAPFPGGSPGPGRTVRSYTDGMLRYNLQADKSVETSLLPASPNQPADQRIYYYGERIPLNSRLNYTAHLDGQPVYDAPNIVYKGLPSKGKMILGATYSAVEGGFVVPSIAGAPELYIPASGTAGNYSVHAEAIHGSAYAPSDAQTVIIRDGPPLVVTNVSTGLKYQDDTGDAATYAGNLPATPLTLSPVLDPVTGTYYARIRVDIAPVSTYLPADLPGYKLRGLGNETMVVGGNTVTLDGIGFDSNSPDRAVYRDLMPGRTYTISLSGQGGSDPVDYKRTITVTVAPEPKMVATAAAVAGHVKVTWTPHTWGVTGYSVERTTDLIGASGWSVVGGAVPSTLSPTATSFTDNGADVGTAYLYRVRIYRSDGIGNEPAPYYSDLATYTAVAGGESLIADPLS